jgi:hypothetical protein
MLAIYLNVYLGFIAYNILYFGHYLLKGKMTKIADATSAEIDDDQDDADGDQERTVLYSVDETPPWHLCILLGFQV